MLAADLLLPLEMYQPTVGGLYFKLAPQTSREVALLCHPSASVRDMTSQKFGLEQQNYLAPFHGMGGD